MSNLRSDPTKIAAARSYFESKFPGCAVSDRHETDTISEVFTIENATTRQAYRVKISREFLDDNSSQVIQQKLERWKVADIVMTSKRSLAYVRNRGVTAE